MANTPAIVAEHTPNPDAIKFLVGVELVVGAHDYTSASRAKHESQLAAALLECDGVERVYLGPDFVVVTKSAAAEWRALGDVVMRVLREFLESGEPAVNPGVNPRSAGTASSGEEAARLQQVLETEIHPLVAAHGGAVELLDYSGGVARLALHGACAGCPASELTLRIQIERRLKAILPDLVRVEQG